MLLVCGEHPPADRMKKRKITSGKIFILHKIVNYSNGYKKKGDEGKQKRNFYNKNRLKDNTTMKQYHSFGNPRTTLTINVCTEPFIQ